MSTRTVKGTFLKISPGDWWWQCVYSSVSKAFPLTNMKPAQSPDYHPAGRIVPSFCTQCQESIPRCPNVTSTSRPSSLSAHQLPWETWKVTHNHSCAPSLFAPWHNHLQMLRVFASQRISWWVPGSGRGSECRSRIVDIWSGLWDSACAVCFARITAYQCKVPWNWVMCRAPG